MSDHKPIVAIFKKASNTLTENTMNSTQNMLMLSQSHIQAWTRFVHSRLAFQKEKHKENKDAEIPCMELNNDAIQTTTSIPDCMTIHELPQAVSLDENLQCLKEHIIQSLPGNRAQIPQDMTTYWTFWDDMGVIDGVILKGRGIVIPEPLQRQALEQLYFDHMGVEKN